MKHLPYHHAMTACAIVLLFTGLIVRYWVGKRRFNRRTIAGLQQFENYQKALFVITCERIANCIGTLLIVTAIVLYFIT